MTYRLRTTGSIAARAAFLIVVTLAVAGAAAQTMPKEGKYEYTSCWSGTSNVIQFSKTHIASTSDFIGNNRTNPPGGPFDMTTFHCVGMSSSVDGKETNSNYCEASDKDGDKWMVRTVSQGPQGTNETLAGTGKYVGMVRSGTSESAGAFPAIKPGTFTGCNRQTGTYKLK